jgi:hypothetical protein
MAGGTCLVVWNSSVKCLLGWLRSPADLARGRHRIEHAGDDLGRPRAARFVRRLCFEQLRVREDDAELIVQAVEQKTKI